MTDIELKIISVYMQAIEIAIKKHACYITKEEIVKCCAKIKKSYPTENFWVNKMPWVCDIFHFVRKERIHKKPIVEPYLQWAITVEALGMTFNYDEKFMNFESEKLNNAILNVFENILIFYDDNKKTKNAIKSMYNSDLTDFKSLLIKFRDKSSQCRTLLNKLEEDCVEVNKNCLNLNFYNVFNKENKGLKKYVRLIKEMYPNN